MTVNSIFPANPIGDFACTGKFVQVVGLEPTKAYAIEYLLSGATA